MVWLPEIDSIIDNLRPGEVWAHASRSGGLKTTMAINACYDRLLRGQNVRYYSFEQTSSEVKRRLNVLHSCHPKWGLPSRPPLDDRSWGLTREEGIFYDRVAVDLSSYGVCEVVDREMLTAADIRNEIQS